jgi:hypothetical protein
VQERRPCFTLADYCPLRAQPHFQSCFDAKQNGGNADAECSTKKSLPKLGMFSLALSGLIFDKAIGPTCFSDWKKSNPLGRLAEERCSIMHFLMELIPAPVVLLLSQCSCKQARRA